MSTERIERMTPSATAVMEAKVADLKAAGVPIISLNIGEPDFGTPKHITDACAQAIAEGKTKYVSTVGIPELRRAICEKLRKDNGLEYQPNDVICSTGAKQSLYNAVMAVCSAGDEIIVPVPCWVSYVEMIKLADGVPVTVECLPDFHLDIEAIRKAITPRTRAIMINTPNNPTGAVYTEDELRQLGELAVEHNFLIITDEVYEKLVYNGEKHVSIASLSPEIKKKCITVNGFSKAYAMTGWRLGYCVAEPELVKAMTGFQGHTTSNSTTFVQWAAIAALEGTQKPLEDMLMQFNKRREFLYERLRKIPGITCNPAGGAFYLMPDVSSYFGKSSNCWVINSSSDMCEYLLEEAHAATVPGEAFFSPNCVRISYSNSLENISKALDQIETALLRLK